MGLGVGLSVTGRDSTGLSVWDGVGVGVGFGVYRVTGGRYVGCGVGTGVYRVTGGR